nr:hypothetical protein [Tanacetum cinerariifolium]
MGELTLVTFKVKPVGIRIQILIGGNGNGGQSNSSPQEGGNGMIPVYAAGAGGQLRKHKGSYFMQIRSSIEACISCKHSNFRILRKSATDGGTRMVNHSKYTTALARGGSGAHPTGDGGNGNGNGGQSTSSPQDGGNGVVPVYGAG